MGRRRWRSRGRDEPPPTSLAGGKGAKGAKGAKVGSEVTTRLPSSGLKAAKTAKLMGNSAAFAVFASLDTLLSGAG